MTNHPNRSRASFTVRYGRDVAKFTSNRDAMRFAVQGHGLSARTAVQFAETYRR